MLLQVIDSTQHSKVTEMRNNAQQNCFGTFCGYDTICTDKPYR